MVDIIGVSGEKKDFGTVLITIAGSFVYLVRQLRLNATGELNKLSFC